MKDSAQGKLETIRSLQFLRHQYFQFAVNLTVNRAPNMQMV